MRIAKVFGLALCLGFFACLLLSGTSVAFGQVTQESYGDQSPAITAEGDVSIIYNSLSKEEREAHPD